MFFTYRYHRSFSVNSIQLSQTDEVVLVNSLNWWSILDVVLYEIKDWRKPNWTICPETRVKLYRVTISFFSRLFVRNNKQTTIVFEYFVMFISLNYITLFSIRPITSAVPLRYLNRVRKVHDKTTYYAECHTPHRCRAGIIAKTNGDRGEYLWIEKQRGKK